MEKSVNFITGRYIDATTWPGFKSGLDGRNNCSSQCSVQFSVGFVPLWTRLIHVLFDKIIPAYHGWIFVLESPGAKRAAGTYECTTFTYSTSSRVYVGSEYIYKCVSCEKYTLHLGRSYNLFRLTKHK